MTDLVHQWWVWISASLLLGILEVVVPGYFFLGFALGALVLGVLMTVGLAPAPVAGVIALFAVLSLLAYLGLRLVFKLEAGQVKIWDRDINDN